ncbi:MAG: substrate-binding domain-containing protein [Planctomycetes bacterium]|nr:substrate-binding domain-containing protein [Planctomycetota bacterium]
MLATALGALGSCADPPPAASAPTLRYVGSSTIANFLRDAEPTYGRARFVLDTEPESAGGELAILDGSADLAGVAGRPRAETLEKGIVATQIGQDAIAVVVNQANPLKGLTGAQLKEIFTGRVRNWKELGGQDLDIRPFVVAPSSATRNIFRSAVLGESQYAYCEEVRPDAAILSKVEADPGAIGTISFSFLGSCRQVTPVSVNGQEASPSNSRYPIVRPLYLLSWPSRGRAAEFVSWTSSPEARSILLQRFALPVEASNTK